MARVGTRRNLEEGGTYDILFMGFPNGFPRGYVSFEFTDTPRKITGIQKVVQLFLKVLLSRRGSDPIRPSYGTVFTDYVVGSNLGSSSSELNAVIRDQISSAEKQCIQMLSSSKGDTSSQLARAEVIAVVSSGEGMTLQMKITTVAGAQAVVAIPFPQGDLAING